MLSVRPWYYHSAPGAPDYIAADCTVEGGPLRSVQLKRLLMEPRIFDVVCLWGFVSDDLNAVNVTDACVRQMVENDKPRFLNRYATFLPLTTVVSQTMAAASIVWVMGKTIVRAVFEHSNPLLRADF